jgi:hypothetical protein
MILINEYGNGERYRSLVVLNLRELYANSRTVAAQNHVFVDVDATLCLTIFYFFNCRCILCLHERKNHRIPPARQLLAHTRTQSHSSIAY